MSGRIFVVGLGPGHSAQATPEAKRALAEATDLVGYGPYVARVCAGPQVVRHASDNRVELERAKHALMLAEAGRVVAVVSGGDAGVFGMASAVFEAIEHGPVAWRALDVRVVAGVSALLAAAARLGAPLGGDFAAISLSDNLKPWDLVLRRLRLCAEAGLVVALYNPRSQARPWQLDAAFDAVRDILPPETIVAFARAIGREDEAVRVETLAQARGAFADMSTLVLIGAPLTRRIEREGREPWLYTPRRIEAS